MCLLAIHYQTLDAAPILVAANREEFFNRPWLSPYVQPGPPAFLAGIDQQARGTWLGVNACGVVAAVTNRPRRDVPSDARSRGLLCREMLLHRSADEAAGYAADELRTGRYAGANFLVADAATGFMIEADETVRSIPLKPGLHLLTNGPVDNPADPRQSLAREMFAAQPIENVAQYLQVAQRVCSQGLDPKSGRAIVLRLAERGTVSSTLIAITKDNAQVVHQFAAGAPDVTPYRDQSGELRQLLATGRDSAPG